MNLKQKLAQIALDRMDEERADCWSSSAVESATNIEQALKDKNT